MIAITGFKGSTFEALRMHAAFINELHGKVDLTVRQ